jgi:hypothetical protein
MASEPDWTTRGLLSAAEAQYRYDGEPVIALKLAAMLHKLDSGRAVRVVDLEAAIDLALAKVAPDGG